MHSKHGRKVSHSFLGVATIITAEGIAVVCGRAVCFQILYVVPQLGFEKLCVCGLSVWTVDSLPVPAAMSSSSMDPTSLGSGIPKMPCMGLTPVIPVLRRSGQEKAAALRAA